VGQFEIALMVLDAGLQAAETVNSYELSSRAERSGVEDLRFACGEAKAEEAQIP
jgi:hypothetical protein